MIARTIFESILEPENAGGQQQRFTRLLIASTVVMLLAIIVIEIATRPRGAEAVSRDVFALGAVVLINLALFVLTYENAVGYAALGAILLLTIATALTRLTGFDAYSEPLAVLTLIAAATVGTTPVYAFVNGVVFVTIGVAVWQEFQAIGSVADSDVTHHLLFALGLLILSAATRYFVASIEQALARSNRNQQLLQTSAELGQITSRLLDLDEVLNRTIAFIHDHSGFYHVQVFLVNDTGDQAVLAASTGEVGRQLLARNHRLAVGSQSVIGQVTRRGAAIIAGDTDTDAVHARNELLPDTRSELALPLMDGETIIGALDVQSTHPNAFSRDDVQALQVTANLLATAIRNARLFEAQNRTAEDNARLLEEAQGNLREIERLNQQLTRRGWANYLDEARAITGITLQEDRIVTETDWTAGLVQAEQERRPVRVADGGRQVVAVPLVLRGEVIGAIEVEPEQAGEAETVEMVEAVAQRLALSLDNARLFEEAQKATAQEQRINEIVARYQTLNTVDELLRVTLTELSQSLGAKRGAIRLGRVENGGNGHD